MKNLVTNFINSELFVKVGLFIVLFILTLLFLIGEQICLHPEKISYGF